MTGRLNSYKQRQQTTDHLGRLVGKLVDFNISVTDQYSTLYSYWKVKIKNTSLCEAYNTSITSVNVKPDEAVVLLAEVEYEEVRQRWFCLVLHPEHGLLVKTVSVEWALALRAVEP